MILSYCHARNMQHMMQCIATGSPLQELVYPVPIVSQWHRSLVLYIPPQGNSETTHCWIMALTKQQPSYMQWVRWHQQVLRWVPSFFCVSLIKANFASQVLEDRSSVLDLPLLNTTRLKVLITHLLALPSHLPLDPNPSRGSLWLISDANHQPLPSKPIDSQQPKGLPKGQSRKARATYLNWQIPCLPSILLALKDEGLVFLELHRPLFPGCCRLDNHHLFGPCWPQDNVWSNPGYLSRLYRSACFSQSHAVAKTPLLFASTAALSPALTKWMKQGTHGLLYPIYPLCQDFAMVPPIFAISEARRPWGEDMFKVGQPSTVCAAGILWQPPCVEVRWSGHDIINGAQQELDSVSFHAPDVLLCQSLPLHVLPSCPASLLVLCFRDFPLHQAPTLPRVSFLPA